VVEFFEKRNHTIYVILPNWRKEQVMSTQPAVIPTGGPAAIAQQPTAYNAEQEGLIELEEKGVIHFTPSKRVGSKHIKCDDDYYIVQLAVAKDGVIVSNNNFKRQLNHNDDFKRVIEERVLMYSFIDDTFMPVEDPLGMKSI
jgi:ribonuclease ZC3H12